MALTAKCERCGVIADVVADDPLPKGWGRVRIWLPNSGQRDRVIDLCEQCIALAEPALTTTGGRPPLTT